MQLPYRATVTAFSVFCVAFTAAGAAPLFSDLSATDRDYAAIGALSSAYYTNGYPDGTFRPDAPITRAEFVKLVILVAGTPTSAVDEACTYELRFRDVDKAGSLRAFVCQASVAGIASGYSDGTFRPTQPISRGEAARMMVGGLTVCARIEETPYTDIETSPFADAIRQLYAMVWYQPGGLTFSPELPLTRREAAQMLARALRHKRPSLGECVTQ